jgi:DeoR family transcriptional regulator, fructose operon transcriptional repressor
MFSDERRQEILNMLERNGRVLAKDLASHFDMSIDSIRRDLSIMEEQGLLKRTHGGAIPAVNVRRSARSPEKRYGEGSLHQQAIAELAVSYIQEKETVFIGGASIHFSMLKLLPTKIRFTVLTNSVEIAYHLRDFENIQTYLIGGNVKSSGNITDSLATEFAKQFTADLCFATAGGLSSKGLSTASPDVAIFHKTVYDNSRRIIALIESHKIGIEMFSHMYPLTKLDVIITDEETPHDQIAGIISEGVEVLVAKNEDK